MANCFILDEVEVPQVDGIVGASLRGRPCFRSFGAPTEGRPYRIRAILDEVAISISESC